KERTLLHRIQGDILRRERSEPARGGESGEAAAADGSVIVLEHASVRREIEAVASEIWRLVEADESLRFDAIAVLVPEGNAAEYAAQVSAVFREAHDLPHRLRTAGHAARAGSVVEAAELLLALPLGRFTRQEVLRILLHPMVLEGMGEVDAVR